MAVGNFEESCRPFFKTHCIMITLFSLFCIYLKFCALFTVINKIKSKQIHNNYTRNNNNTRINYARVNTVKNDLYYIKARLQNTV